MKRTATSIESIQSNFSALTDNEMLNVRGGGRPPVARPRDEYDTGDDDTVSYFSGLIRTVTQRSFF